MAVTRFLARMLIFKIRTSTGPDVYAEIGGLNNISHSDASVDADTTGFDSEGREESMVAQRGESWTLGGFKQLDIATGDEDAGQAAVEALAQEIGPASVGHFMIVYPDGSTEDFDATAKHTKPGGGNNDPANWSVVVKVTGGVTYTPAESS